MTMIDRGEPAPSPGSDAAGDEKAGSLLPVIRVIPKSAYENPTWKGLAFFARDLVFYGLVVWGITSTDNPLLLVPLWAVAALVVSGLFIIGHDAAHEALFKSRRLNSIVGHVAMLPSWHVYEAWVLGHNRIHHGHTVREGMDFVWHPITPEQFGEMSRYQRLRHRVEWSWWGAGFYYLREIWFNKMITFNPPAKWAKAIRRDIIFMFAGVGLGMALFGWIGWLTYGSALGVVWMIVKVVVIPFLGLQLRHRLGRPRAPRAARHPLVVPPGLDQVPGPDGGHHHPAGAVGHRPVLPFDHGPHPSSRGHAHPVLRARTGRRRHQGRVPRRGPRREAALPRLHPQHPRLQALRLHRGSVDDLRRGHGRPHQGHARGARGPGAAPLRQGDHGRVTAVGIG